MRNIDSLKKEADFRRIYLIHDSLSDKNLVIYKAPGSGKLGIIFRVYLHEAVPDLIRVITVTAISLIGLTTMAGAVGAGGIGSFAINYGQNLHHQDIVNVCVLVLLVFVSLIQTLGSGLSRRTTDRALFRRMVRAEEPSAPPESPASNPGQKS